MHIDTAIPCIVILIVIDVHTDQGMRVTGRSCHELNNHARRIRTRRLENMNNWKLCDYCGLAFKIGCGGKGQFCDATCRNKSSWDKPYMTDRGK